MQNEITLVDRKYIIQQNLGNRLAATSRVKRPLIKRNNLQVSNICKSLRGFIPSVPPNTKRLSPTVVQLWLSLGVGGVPFIAGWLHV